MDIQKIIDELELQKDNSYERELTDESIDFLIKMLKKQEVSNEKSRNISNSR